ncbi:ArsR/SmtB family transcription factor [Nesterenkonia sedimenti]|uniref:ArsR/SmtB family transcription factor n=1 Tax=Nesterenkonia sedimenti TaxID=1463632 RepID=UPI002D21C95D|nr:metalloregulator ArsR/SmtB family transcription factor [Nesterenkonia sedimenti]
MNAIDPEHASDLAVRFKALGDPNRIALLSLIAAGENAEACVCDLTEPLGLGQPTVSHHLRILTDAGFLNRQKRGTWSYYSIVPGALQSLCSDLCDESGLGAMLQVGSVSPRNGGDCC